MEFPQHTGKSTKTALGGAGRKKVHTSFEDGSQLVEEYDAVTLEIMVRKHKYKTKLGVQSDWVFEIGEPDKKFDPDRDMVVQSNNNPQLVRRDTPSHFQWRIRNLPYDKDVFTVTIDTSKPAHELVVRTSNKKYFKRISMSDVVKLEESELSWEHENNTLIISYRKPASVLQREKLIKEELSKVKSSEGAQKEEGSPECKQQ